MRVVMSIILWLLSGAAFVAAIGLAALGLWVCACVSVVVCLALGLLGVKLLLATVKTHEKDDSENNS